MLEEFKKFAMRGSVVDLAVGVIIGGAFGKITDSLVKDVIMPPIGLLLGQVDFSNLYINLSKTKYPSLAAAKAAGAPTINYGAFINSIIDFFILAFVVFLLVRWIHKVTKHEEPVPVAMKPCPECARDIPEKARRCPECTSVLVTT